MMKRDNPLPQEVYFIEYSSDQVNWFGSAYCVFYDKQQAEDEVKAINGNGTDRFYKYRLATFVRQI